MSFVLHKGRSSSLIVLTKVSTTTIVLTKPSERGFNENMRLSPFKLIYSVLSEHVPTQVVTLFIQNHVRNRAPSSYLISLKKRRKRERDDGISEGAAAPSMKRLYFVGS